MFKIIKYLTPLFLLGFFILFTPNTFASTVVTDDIFSDTVWDSSGSPYIVNTNLYIAPSATLTINAGVVVKFASSASLEIFGKLNVNGEVNSKVYFTSNFNDALGGSTDDYESCGEEVDADGNPTGIKVCDIYDWADPSPGDWQGISFFHSTGNNLNNSEISFTGESALELYETSVNSQGLKIENSTSGIMMYENSHLIMNDVLLKNLQKDAFMVFNDSSVEISDALFSFIGNSPVTIFNESSFTATGIVIENITSNYTDVIALFNGSDLIIKNSTFKSCPPEACVTFFDGSDYLSSPSSIYIDSSLFDGGLASALLTFGDSEITTDIKNSIFKNFASFAIENYSPFSIKAENNDWGGSSGPYHDTLNPTGEGEAIYGDVDFDPWVGKEDEFPEVYFAKVKDTPNGIAQMYSDANPNSTLIKTFPNDWILKVFKKTLVDGWVKVQDMTDDSFGWVELPFKYEESKQEEYENNSKDILNTLELRRQSLLEAVDFYYDNTSIAKSLYSSDDSPAVYNISKLKNASLPKELILAILAQESGSVNFNNENVSFDYGHGITQVTMHAKKDYTKNSSDPRGVTSLVYIKRCKNFLTKQDGSWDIGSDEYKNCYKSLLNSKGNVYANDYDHYAHDDSNPKYKQYSNTRQSIYANIKDGLSILSSKYGTIFSHPCSGSFTIESIEFTCQDLKILKTVWGYNGAVLDPKFNYMRDVSSKLKNLSNYFPGVSYVNTDNLVEKLNIANRNRKEIKVHSPVELRVKSSNGEMTGLSNGVEENNIPNSFYDASKESLVIFFPEDSYIYEVVGDSVGGTYGLDIDIFDDSEEPLSFRSVDLPIKTGEIHTYKIDEQKLKNSDPKAVSIDIDEDGDGKVERTIYSDNTLESLNEEIASNPNPPGAVLLNIQNTTINTEPIYALIIKAPTSIKTEVKTPISKKVVSKNKSNTTKLVKKDIKENKVVKKPEIPLQASAVQSVKRGWFKELIKRLFNR